MKTKATREYLWACEIFAEGRTRIHAAYHFLQTAAELQELIFIRRASPPGVVCQTFPAVQHTTHNVTFRGHGSLSPSAISIRICADSFYVQGLV